MEVKCTQCGGEVPVEIDQGLASCPYCSSSLYVSLNDGFLHYVITPTLKEKDLDKTLKTFLARKERKSGLVIREAAQIFWPYWRIQQDAETKTFIAATNPITSLERASIPDGDTKPFLKNKVDKDRFEMPGEPIEDLIEREGISASKVWLAHVPFWIVDYEYDSVKYQAWIDAVRGEVYADDLPPAFTKEKDRLYARAAWFIFAVFFILGAAISNGDYVIPLYVLASVPLYYITKRTLKGAAS